MPSYDRNLRAAAAKRVRASWYDEQTSKAIGQSLDRGRRSEAVSERGPDGDPKDSETFRVRGGPTRLERMNRALKELGSSAFKIHTLLWQWRGAPAKGNLPFFTIHSLSKYCSLTRPTVRVGLRELVDKGWIEPGDYDRHYKNTLFRLVAIRRIPVLTSAKRLGNGGETPPQCQRDVGNHRARRPVEDAQ